MKRSFTLIELLISITISALILSLLFESIQVSKTSNDAYTRAYIKKLEQSNFLRVLNQDLVQAKKRTIKIKNRKTENILSFRSYNSQKGYTYPYISYIYSQDKLFRVESKYAKIESKKILANDIDLISSIKEFKAYKDRNSSTKHSILIYYTDNIKNKHTFQIPLY